VARFMPINRLKTPLVAINRLITIRQKVKS
jgi:hypothetical protein